MCLLLFLRLWNYQVVLYKIWYYGTTSFWANLISVRTSVDASPIFSCTIFLSNFLWYKIFLNDWRSAMFIWNKFQFRKLWNSRKVFSGTVHVDVYSATWLVSRLEAYAEQERTQWGNVQWTCPIQPIVSGWGSQDCLCSDRCFSLPLLFL